MREFHLEDNGVEVVGQALEPFLAGLGPYRSRGERVLARNFGVSKVEVTLDAAYPAQGLLDALREFQEQFGPAFMRKTGNLVFKTAVFPPGIDSIAKAYGLLDVAYNMNHRNAQGKIGRYSWTAQGSRAGHIVCDGPYPCSYDLGIVEGIARRLEPGAVVTHADPELCRHTGADRCAYYVEW